MLGAPITGATYQHLPAGPAPRQLLNARRYLLDSGTAVMEPREYFSGNQARLVPQRPADRSAFTPRELEIIDSVIAEFWPFNGRQISKYSHDEWGWKVTEDFEDMPYYLAWVSSGPLTIDQIEEGHEIAKAYGFLV